MIEQTAKLSKCVSSVRVFIDLNPIERSRVQFPLEALGGENC